jgi:hypothetical protein
MSTDLAKLITADTRSLSRALLAVVPNGLSAKVLIDAIAEQGIPEQHAVSDVRRLMERGNLSFNREMLLEWSDL